MSGKWSVLKLPPSGTPKKRQQVVKKEQKQGSENKARLDNPARETISPFEQIDNRYQTEASIQASARERQGILNTGGSRKLGACFLGRIIWSRYETQSGSKLTLGSSLLPLAFPF